MFHRNHVEYRKKADSTNGHNNHTSPFNEILRNVLYLTSFLAYGLGDSMSATHMILIKGVGAELNPIMRYIFMTNGVSGLIMFKLGATVIILGSINIMCVKSKEYMNWTVTGFLLSLTLGGILATLANLSIASDMPFTLSSLEISLLFVVSIVVSITLGDILDARHKKNIIIKSDITIK